MEDTSGLRFSFSTAGRNGLSIVTATLDDNTVAVDKFDLTKSTARNTFTKALTEEFPGIDAGDVARALLCEAARLSTHDEPTDHRETDPLEAMPDSIKHDAREMLHDPELVRIIVDDIEAIGVAGEKALAATIYVIGTSRLLGKPLAGIVQGPTSSGKSFVIARVASLFPPEALIRAHRMTPEALVHLPHGALVHRFVVGGERSRRQDDQAADATRALREMLSDGRLTKLIPLKRRGEFETVAIDQPGPIAYVESTTIEGVLDEDRNRCIVLATDEGSAQTRRIIESIARRKMTADAGADVDTITQRHFAAQRMLGQCRVVIPFAERLAAHFAHERTDARRSFGQLISTIEAVTLLHQFQRSDNPVDSSVITATAEDYRIAQYLIAGPMARTQAGKVSGAAQRFWERLRAWAGADTFTTEDVGTRETIVGDIQTIRSYVKTLADHGYLRVVEESRGNKPARYALVADPPGRAAESGLPAEDVVFECTGLDSPPRRRDETEAVATT